MNLVGSFSDYDWFDAETDRMALLMRETVLPTTSPVGIQDSIRVDNFNTKPEYDTMADYYDGSFECWIANNDSNQMVFSCGAGHELGHTTLGLPDIYGQGVHIQNMLLKDENGQPYARTPVYPSLFWSEDAPFSAATSGYPDSLLVGYTPLMDYCHMWLENFCGGIPQFRRGQRQFDFWGDCANWIPAVNTLKLFDVNDDALANARVYIHQVVNEVDKYYPDRPKFIGSTDASGCFTIPSTTCEYWDDWTTDAVDGSVPVSTPFATASGRIGASHSYVSGDILLLKIVGEGGQVEFQTLSLAEVNAGFFAGDVKGDSSSAIYNIRTSLTSPSSVPNIVEPSTPAGGKRPIVRVACSGQIYSGGATIIVPRGTVLTLDGSVSYDPEGQPLTYRWTDKDSNLISQNAIYTIDTNYYALGDVDLKLFVFDGIRYSSEFAVKVKIVSPLADAKHQADGSSVTLDCKQITAMPGGGVSSGIMYIEEADKSNGIRVSLSGVSYSTIGLGDYVTLNGTIQTTSDGERYVVATSISKVGAERLMEPTGVVIASVSMEENLGRFISFTGTVDVVSSTSFTVKDDNGSSIMVYCSSLAKPTSGQRIRIRGISSYYNGTRCLLLRCKQDWVPYTDVNWPKPLDGKAQLRDWLILGPFGPQGNQGYALSYDYISTATGGASKETSIQPSTNDPSIGGKSWFRSDGVCEYSADWGEAIDLNRLLGGDSATKDSTVYAHIYVWSPTANSNVDMMVRSDDGVRVFLNGSQVLLNNIGRGYGDSEDRVPVSLLNGWNRVMIKVHNGAYSFGFACRFVTRNTNTALTGLAYQLSTKTIDPTPPIVNLVVDDGDRTLDATSLHAIWFAEEPESFITEYKYAIGTTPTDPGSGYVVDWTSAGISTNVTATGLSLITGQIYYFYVKAANMGGLWSDVVVSDGIEVYQDTTPPIMETVTAYLYDNTSLYAYWYATDPDTSVSEYKYAIGTSPTDPGSGYAVDWTSAGTNTYVTVSGLNLAYNQFYYVYVKARNGSGFWSSTAVSNSLLLEICSIGEAKLLPLETKVTIKDAVCTGQVSYNEYYFQSYDRSAGIRVYASGAYSAGTVVDLTGNISTYNGESRIAYPTITAKGTTTVTPLGLNNASVGGSKIGLQEAIWGWKWVKKEDGTSEYKLLPDSGLNNVGLLVKTTGKVTYIDPAGAFAYIDDGSHADDGNTLGLN
jgi:hypothetical protein